MAIETQNFIFGDDFLNKSLPEFKAHMKKKHGVSAKNAKAIYDEMHGNITPVQPIIDEDS